MSLAAGAMLALGAFAGPAMAAGAGEVVSGTTLGTLALTGTSATFTTGFDPGGTAAASGLLTATNTAATSTLTVLDAVATAPGHMLAAGTGCTGSAPSLTNALTTNVTGSGVTGAGAKSITGTATTVASATAPLAAAALSTAYTQVIPSAQVMLTGCVYSLTASYTLQ